MCLCLRNTTVRTRPGSLPPRARESFFPSILFLPSLFFVPPAATLFPRGFWWRNHFCQWSPAHVTSRILYAGISPSGHHRVSVEILSPSSPLSPTFIVSFPSRSRPQLAVKNSSSRLSFLDNVLNIIVRVTFVIMDPAYPWSHLESSSDDCTFSLSSSVFFSHFSSFSVLLLQKVFSSYNV